MKYLVGVTDLYYKETKIILIKAKNKIEAMMEAACSVDKGETLAGEVKNMQLGKKGKRHTIKSLKIYLIDYWKISISTPVEVNHFEEIL
jgi:hypothetical protein